MNQFTLDTFRTWLRHSIELATDARCEPGDVALVLREEASHLTGDGYQTSDPDDYLYELPSDDPAVETEGVLAQVIAGVFGAVRIRFHDLELRHLGDEYWASVWAVHDVETGEHVGWVNAAAFRSPADLEDYLRQLEE